MCTTVASKPPITCNNTCIFYRCIYVHFHAAVLSLVTLLCSPCPRQPQLRSTEEVEIAKRELESIGFENTPYDNVVFTFHPSFAAEQLVTVGNWDGPRKSIVRSVLQRARNNFHRHPRQWWVVSRTSGVVLRCPPQRFLNEIPSFETSSRAYLVKNDATR